MGPIPFDMGEEVPPPAEDAVPPPPPPVEEDAPPDPPPVVDPPPPSPPLLAEVMARQTHLLETLAEGLLRRNGGPPNDFQRKLEGFLKLRPPTFDNSADPMDAEDWLREIEKKLDMTTCSDEECVGVASHQLTGAARAWWDSFCGMHPDPGRITWEEFTEAFREYHVPEGVMEAKVEEFKNLTQGSMKVQEYANRFVTMMRYAPEETNTEKKKCTTSTRD